MGSGPFRSLDLDEEAIVFPVPGYFAMHSIPRIADAKPDSETQGNFMGKEGVGHASGAYLIGGNPLKTRIILSKHTLQGVQRLRAFPRYLCNQKSG